MDVLGLPVDVVDGEGFGSVGRPLLDLGSPAQAVAVGIEASESEVVVFLRHHVLGTTLEV